MRIPGERRSKGVKASLERAPDRPGSPSGSPYETKEDASFLQNQHLPLVGVFDSILLQSSGLFVVLESPSFLKDVHFYDYSMFPDDGTPGINDLSNYEPGAKLDDIVEKRDKIKVYGKQLADGSIEWHNTLFGMRFDVMFNTDQYSDLSKMNFHFSGDDDLWVFVDGKLALNVGGNHGDIPGSVDIGNYIDKDEVGKDHQLTVLYLERGGNYSNCAVSFTLPTTNAMEFKEADTTNAIINKVDKKTQKALSNAGFTLSDSKNNKQTYTTDNNGQIALTGLTEGDSIDTTLYLLLLASASSGLILVSMWRRKNRRI